MADYVSEPSVLELKSIEPGCQPIEAISACGSREAQRFDIPDDPITEVREMLELSDSGEQAVWPDGMGATGARRQQPRQVPER